MSSVAYPTACPVAPPCLTPYTFRLDPTLPLEWVWSELLKLEQRFPATVVKADVAQACVQWVRWQQATMVSGRINVWSTAEGQQHCLELQRLQGDAYLAWETLNSLLYLRGSTVTEGDAPERVEPPRCPEDIDVDVTEDSVVLETLTLLSQGAQSDCADVSSPYASALVALLYQRPQCKDLWVAQPALLDATIEALLAGATPVQVHSACLLLKMMKDTTGWLPRIHACLDRLAWVDLDNPHEQHLPWVEPLRGLRGLVRAVDA